MKKIYFLMMSFFTMTFINAQVLSEGFDTGTIPAGWTQEYVSGTEDWDAVTTNGDGSISPRTGSHMAEFRVPSFGGEATKLITPQLDITTLTAPQLTFYYANAPWGTDTDELRVYYKTSVGGAWTQIGVDYTVSQTSWTKVDLILPSPTADYYIAFEATTNYARGLNLDDVLVDEAPSCIAPNALTASNLTTTSADLEWTDNTGGSATGFELEIGAAGFTPTGTATNTSATSPFNATGLTANTSYDFYVRADCGGGDFSVWVGPFNFTTSCNAISSFPWTEDFESVTTPTLPSCWIQIDNNNDLDEFVTYTTYGVGSSQAAGLYTDYNSGNNDDYLILPPFTLTGNEEFSFSYRTRSDSEADEFEVLLSTTGRAPSDFTQTIIPTTTVSSTTYASSGLIDLSAYTGDVYIAIHIPNSSTDGYYIYFDEFELNTIPSCLQPNALAATNISGTTADLEWTDNTGGSAVGFELEVGAVGFTPTGTATNTSTTSPFNATSLTANTSYDFYVRADCGGGDFSAWAGPFTFFTGYCQVSTTSTVDYLSGISSMGAVQNISYTASSQPAGSYADETAQNFESYETQVIEINTSYVGGGNGVNIWVDWNNNLTFDPSELVANLANASATKTLTFTVPASTPIGDYTMRVRGQYGSSANPPACGNVSYGSTVDFNLEIVAAPSCLAPSILTATNISGNSADLDWTDNAGAGLFDIELGTTGFTPTGTPTESGITVTPHQVTGLSPLTSYEYYVRADCGGGDFSAWAGPFTFTTGQIPVSTFPYTQDWEAGQGSWQFTSGETNYWVVGSATSNGGSNSLYVTNDGSSYFYDVNSTSYSHAYRDFSIPSGNPVIKISFDWKGEGEDYFGSAYDYLNVFVTSTSYTPTAGTEITSNGTAPLGEVQLNGEFLLETNYINEFLQLDPAYDGQTFRLVFQWQNDGIYGSSNPASIDNILVEIESCGEPTNLSSSNITTTTADIDWDAFGSETNWNVQYGPSGFAIGSGTIWDVSVASDTTLDNLMQYTEYDVYVQADCGSGDVSSWVGPITFTTEPDCEAPAAFQETGGTANSIDLSFVNMASGVTSWNIEYGPAPYTPGSGGTIENVTTTTPTITGLLPGTVYEFYVESDCPNNNPFAGPVTYATPIVNDAACDAIAVPVDGSTATYSNIDATLETGELTSDFNTVWFTFTAPADGHVEINTCGNTFDNFIEVYEATDCADFSTFTLVEDATDNPFATCNGTFDPAGLELCGLTPGNTYYLAVGSETDGNTGTFPLKLTAIQNANAGNGTTTQVCAGDIVNLNGAISGNDNGGVWSEIDMTGGLEPNAMYNTAGLAYVQYDVQYEVTNACSTDATIVTVDIMGPSQAGTDGSITDCNVDMVYLFDGLSGTVDFGGTWIDNDATGNLNGNVFTPNGMAGGTYTFDYVVSNAVCPNDTSTVTVNLTDCLSTDELNAESFNLYPNPTTGTFFLVSGINANNALVEITDLQGKVVLSEVMNLNKGSQYDFNINTLERGVYLIKVATEENSTVKRVVLQK